MELKSSSSIVMSIIMTTTMTIVYFYYCYYDFAWYCLLWLLLLIARRRMILVAMIAWRSILMISSLTTFMSVWYFSDSFLILLTFSSLFSCNISRNWIHHTFYSQHMHLRAFCNTSDPFKSWCRHLSEISFNFSPLILW